MYELIYTSVPKGLIPGRSGFATAAMSEGMPPNLIVPLENLSGYNFTLRDGNFLPILNPPCCYYIKMRYGNQQLHVAGRVAPNGLDYSKRNNKIAHHLLFEAAEELDNLAGGVAGLFFKEGVFRSEYTEEPAMLPFRKVPLCMQIGSLPAKHWAGLAGHAGFAAYAAERFRENPDKPLYLIYPPGTNTNDLLNLVMEVSALLNEKLRNYFTFSTYFGSCAASVDCFLRMVPDFSPLVNNLRRFHKNDVIELGQENELPIADNYSDLYEYACTGKRPEVLKPREETQSLTQTTIKILADSGLPPEPVRELLNDTPVITVPPPPQINCRKFVFAGAAAVIIAAAASLLLYDIPSKTNAESTEKAKVVKQPTVQAVSVKAAEPLQATQPAAKDKEQFEPEKNKPDTVKTVVPPPQLPKVNKAKPIERSTVSAPVAGDLFRNRELRTAAKAMPLEPALNLFMEFNRKVIAAEKSKKSRAKLQLPEFLHGCSEFYPVLERIGTSTVDNSQFVSKGSITGEVYVRAAQMGTLPLKPLAGEITDIPHLMIKLAADKKSLQFIKYAGEQSNCIMPQAGYIKQIYFRKQNKVYLWKNKFSRQYISLIKPGKLDIQLPAQNQKNDTITYAQSEREKMLVEFVITQFGKCSAATFLNTPFNFKDWNDSVKEYNKCSNELESARIKINKFLSGKKAGEITSERSKEEIQKTLESFGKLAEDGDFSTFNTKFNDFISSFFNLKEKNLIDTKDLSNQTENFASALKNQQLDKSKRQLIETHKKSWMKKIKQLQDFYDLQKKLADCSKKFEAAQERLKISAERMKNKASQVDASIEKSLLAMMTVAGKSNWQLNPDIVSATEVKKLSQDITGKITFRPVINADGE